mgnify:CR=1 FL=1
MPSYRAQDLRDLCSHCWRHPKLPGHDRCLPWQVEAETLRLVASNDQLDASTTPPVTWGSLEPYQQHPGSDGFAEDSHF